MTHPKTARDEARPSRATLLIGFAVAVLCTGAGVASAQTPPADEGVAEAAEAQLDEPAPIEGSDEVAPGEEPATPQATEPGAGEGAKADDDPAKRGGRARLIRENVTPRQIYWAGREKARFRYEFKGPNTADLVVELVRANKNQVIKRWKQTNAKADKLLEIKWGGRRAGGAHVRKGKFYFRVREKSGASLDRKRASGKRNFRVQPAIFPVRAKHDYWDGWGAGRGHQGQDIGAKCGARMVAAEPGKVAFKGYDGGGYGYYLVINTRSENRALVYSHLKRAAKVRSGANVKTGAPIGLVGDTGNATGCHLHFEYWKGDWPGGHPTPAATKRLRAWDKYS